MTTTEVQTSEDEFASQEERENYSKLQDVLEEARAENDRNIVNILHQAQQIFGHVSRDVQVRIAEELGIPLSEIYSVVSFYSLFSTTARADYTVEVCMGTACYVKGAQEVLDKFGAELDIEPGEVSEDGEFGLETTRCIGACGRAPVIVVNEDIHGGVEVEDIPDILQQYQ
ncbi:NADH-quinone oxidoreductase subunit NuoE family protein [Halanaerobaculum tunisiense]